jgi:hypothetical protein
VANDDIKKTVEISFVVSADELNKGIDSAKGKLNDFVTSREKQTKGSAGEQRTQALRDRVQAVHSKREKRETTQSSQRHLALTKQLAAAERARTSELKKQTAEIQKQVNLLGKVRGGGGGGVGGGGLAATHGAALDKLPGGGGGGGGGGGKGGAGSIVKKFMKRFAVALPAMAMAGLAGMLGSQIRRSVEAYTATELEKAKLQAFSMDKTGFGGAAGLGYGLGYTEAETARQAGGVARATGSVRNVTFAQQVSRSAIGMGVGEATDLMGTLTRGGQTGFEAGGKGKREFEMILARGFESGLERARMPEFMDSIGTLVERQSGISVGDVTGASAAKLLSLFGQSQQSGLRGARGGQVMSRLDQAVRRPGGGQEGEAFMLRAFGFGRPGGTSGFMEARRRMQQGVTGEGGVKNLVDMVTQAQREFGRGEGSTYVLEKMTGLSMDQIIAIKERVDRLKRGGDEESINAEISQFAKKAGPIEDQVNKANLSGFTHTKKELADINKHLVKIGAKFFPPIHSIQKDINRIVDHWSPEMAKMLQAVADTTKAMADGLVPKKDMSMDKSKEVDHQFFQELTKKRQELKAGKISEQEFLDWAGPKKQELHRHINKRKNKWGLGALDPEGQSVKKNLEETAAQFAKDIDAAKEAQRAKRKTTGEGKVGGLIIELSPAAEAVLIDNSNKMVEILNTMTGSQADLQAHQSAATRSAVSAARRTLKPMSPMPRPEGD